MFVLGARRNKIELELIEEANTAAVAPPVRPAALAESSSLVRANRAFFDLAIPARPAIGVGAPARPESIGRTATFREPVSGVLRTVYKEIMLRFKPKLTEEQRHRILGHHGFESRAINRFVKDQVVVVDGTGRRSGSDLVDIANDFASMDEVVFATPNFVSQYRRLAVAMPPVAQWHLFNRAKVAHQLAGEDVDARPAWQVTCGSRNVVIAILDDGVDIEHPNLASRIWRNPSKGSKDKFGRDFFLRDDHPDHFNPRPKKFRSPYHVMDGNDIHGTCCAGVAAAAGKGAYGIAFKCRILAVKVFHADELAPDARVADAIRYAATIADVLSCSWSGGSSPDIELAIEDALRIGRKGKGSLMFAAAGNEYADAVGFPASADHVVAVGASTDSGGIADYSNKGPEMDLVAPSSGGAVDIFTTDVSIPGRGFNVGDASLGDKTGLHTNDFGGTSSATPLAAGVAALVIAANPKLDAGQVRDILIGTADKIGHGYDANGHSPRFGNGRVNAGKAVAAAVRARLKPKRKAKRRPSKQPKRRAR